MQPRRLMRIGFRVSLVATVLAGGYGALKEFAVWSDFQSTANYNLAV
jgi:hypothetical protein